MIKIIMSESEPLIYDSEFLPHIQIAIVFEENPQYKDLKPLFDEYNAIKYKRRTTSNLHFWFQNYNYFHIDSCPIEDIKNTVEKFKSDIVQNRQYHLFYMLNTYRDIDYDKWKWIEHIQFSDVDYLSDYENNIQGCAFETISYHILKDGEHIWDRQIAGTRRKIKKKGTRKKAKKQTKDLWVFERSSFGMPIMYAKLPLLKTQQKPCNQQRFPLKINKYKWEK
jgi:hypothetical protein